MNVPGFIRKPTNNGNSARFEPVGIEDDVMSLPHPRTGDPLNPAVAELMSKAILESGEAYVQSILLELERNAAAAQDLLEQGKAWAEGERARFMARAEDIAAAHKEMQDSRSKFLELPRAPELAPPVNPNAEPF